MSRTSFSILIPSCLLAAASGCSDTYTVEKTDYNDPPLQLSLEDDQLDPGVIPEFDPDLVHPVPVEGWELNLSRTVFRLDTPVLKPDDDADLLMLRPSYADALATAYQILPSVNLIDGKAKQFDDGLYAALDLAYYSGHQDVLRSHVDLIRQIAEKLEPDSIAVPYLAAGLELAGVSFPVTDEQAKAGFLQQFEDNPLRSKPLGFYQWSPELADCYRFLKYFQQQFPITDGKFPDIIQELAAVVRNDPQLQMDYQKAIAFYSQLTNPFVAMSLLEVIDQADLPTVAATQAQRSSGVSVFPASANKEQILFERMFPLGIPEGTDLMQELIRAVQKGDVDLAPDPDSGWYDYQTFALETFLLPDKGDESCKLLLSARYKQRMLDAFAALITKRRETHIRGLETAVSSEIATLPDPLTTLSPRLRLEPNATYFLRTARAYAVLQSFLYESVGESFLQEIKGLRDGGTRQVNLGDELEDQKLLFYGFYLLSMEDIGLSNSLMEDELENTDAARALSLEWLEDFKNDPDLSRDTRIVVPVAIDPLQETTHLWGTAGVRLARLDVQFEAGYVPSVRVAGSEEEWKEFEGDIGKTTYYIPIDEFISVEIPRLDCPTREEFRKLCDEAQSKEKLIELLQNR